MPRHRRSSGNRPDHVSRVRRQGCSRDLARAFRAAGALPAVPRPGVDRGEALPDLQRSGRERRTKRYTVKVPAGVKDGTRIKLKGKGEAGYGGAPAGDLYVIMRVEPSKIYERRGDDLIIKIPVPYTTAALGGKVEGRHPTDPCS